MGAIAEILGLFRTEGERPRDPISPSLNLSSTVGPPATIGDIDRAWAPEEVPAELVELWTASGEARLFCDTEYGQWGLILVTPELSAVRTRRERRERPRDVHSTDIVFGEFLGDPDLLFFAPSEHGDRRIMVDEPIDERAGWYGAGDSVIDFLERYFWANGAKFWDPGRYDPGDLFDP